MDEVEEVGLNWLAKVGGGEKSKMELDSLAAG